MRMPKPFYRRQTRSWYVQTGKRQISLGPDKDKATEKYHTLMIGKQGAGTDLTAATLVKLFLTWNQQHRDAGTQVFYSRPLLSFVEHVGVKLELLSNVVDGRFSGGGFLGFDSVDKFDTLNHVG
jgi:hypothetical protein